MNMNNGGNPGRPNGRNLDMPWRSGMIAAAAANRMVPAANPVPNPVPNPAPSSSNYRGDLQNPRNRSADIPEEENCGTWWTNLPADCTYEMLFDSMRNIGAVSHAVINPPVGSHETSAAKVEFFERAAVDRLMAQAHNGHLRGHMRVAGRIPHITLNRIRVPAHPREVPRGQGVGGRGSRVLRVVGDARVVRVDYLRALLADPRNRVVYGLERASSSVVRADGTRLVEFRFASYAVQAVRARNIFVAQKLRRDLAEEERALWEDVVCFFARDPCE